MQSFRFYNTIKWVTLFKSIIQEKQYTRKSQIFNFGLAATQLLKHTNTSVKGKHKHHSSSTSRNTLGQNTRVKRYKLSTLLHFFVFVFFFRAGQFTEHRAQFILHFCYSRFRTGIAGCPSGHRASSHFHFHANFLSRLGVAEQHRAKFAHHFQYIFRLFLFFSLVVPKTSSKSQQSMFYLQQHLNFQITITFNKLFGSLQAQHNSASSYGHLFLSQ